MLRGPLRELVGADDLEVIVDENVVWPIDADVVDLVVTVAQLHDAVDNFLPDRPSARLPLPCWPPFR